MDQSIEPRADHPAGSTLTAEECDLRMQWAKAVAIFGGIGAAGCLLLWFGITSFWSNATLGAKWQRLPADTRERSKRGLLVGLVVVELLTVVIGLALAAGSN